MKRCERCKHEFPGEWVLSGEWLPEENRYAEECDHCYPRTRCANPGQPTMPACFCCHPRILMPRGGEDS